MSDTERDSTQREAVRSQVTSAMHRFVSESSYRSTLRGILSRRGHILGDTVDTPWYRLVLFCCEATSGQWEVATPVAAAVEMLVAAGNVLDDLEDDDSGPRVDLKKRAIQTNGATGLLHLGRKLISEADSSVSRSAPVAALLEALDDTMLQAYTGQHMDLWLEGLHDINVGQSLRMTQLKAGPLGWFACYSGALVGCGDRDIALHFGDFGWHFSVSAQLGNDLHGLSPSLQQKSDLRRRKMTVPISSLLSDSCYRDHPLVRRFMDRDSILGMREEGELYQVLLASGALHFTWVLAKMYQLKAASVLACLCREREVPDGLWHLLREDRHNHKVERCGIGACPYKHV